MEVIIYAALITLLWILSLSVLLPFALCLKFSKTCRDIWFSWFFVNVTEPLLDHVMLKTRKLGFDRLKYHLKDRKRSRPLEILDIGVGAGAALEFYPENSNLTAVDMNASFQKYLEENLPKYPHVNLKRTVVSMAEDMHEIGDDLFDVVICTYTLCSVRSLRSVLNEIKRVLKPGGKFMCVEHNPYPRTTWTFTLQKFLAPLWNLYFNGCVLTRKTDEEIRNTGFADVVIERHHPKEMWLPSRSHIIVVATK